MQKIKFGEWSHKCTQSYAGWVPNIGSHLSFSLMGTGQGSNVFQFTDHEKTHNVRRISILQHRVTDDFLIPQFIAKHLKSQKKFSQHFLLTAETCPIYTSIPKENATIEISGKDILSLDEQGALLGKVFIFPLINKKDAKRDQKWFLEELKFAILQKQADFLFVDIERYIKWRAPYACFLKFCLFRTGEIRLWFDPETSFPGFDKQTYTYIANQAYLFIKDMTHRHIHHDGASDQITPLIKVSADKSWVYPENEAKWRREILWSLAREAERQSCYETLAKQRESLGILSFADAYQKSILPYIRDAKNPNKITANTTVYGYDFTFIRESTRLKVEQMSSSRTALLPMLGVMVASSIAIVALLCALISTKNSYQGFIHSKDKMINNNDLIDIMVSRNILCFFAFHPAAASILTVALIYSIYRICVPDMMNSPAKWKIAQAMRGISISITKTFNLSGTTSYILFNIIWGFQIVVIMCVVSFIIYEISHIS